MKWLGAEDSTMRRLLLVLFGLRRREIPQGVTPLENAAARRWPAGITLGSVALLVIGCASHSLVPEEQAVAIRAREQALSAHTEAIQESIRQSGRLGALAFLDATDGHLVVVPGDTPSDAWTRYTGSNPVKSPAGQSLVPPVLSFVYRADVPKAPETVTYLYLQDQRQERQADEALRASLALIESELRDLQQRTEARYRELVAEMAATTEGAQKSITAARADMQTAVNSLAEDLAEARRFMLQTAKLGWLNHELNVENGNDIRKIARASQELTSNSVKLADTIRQQSENLADQLKELATRLESIRDSVRNLK
jgi:hypothetical protein